MNDQFGLDIRDFSICDLFVDENDNQFICLIRDEEKSIILLNNNQEHLDTIHLFVCFVMSPFHKFVLFIARQL